MNSENGKLRALLQQALDMLEEQSLHIEAQMQPAGKKLLNQIRAALSRQAEPSPAQSYKDDPRMPAELSLAGCRCVRFGEGNPHWPCRIHTAPAQTEQQPGQSGLMEMIDAAMVEMRNITPPLRRSECERLIRAALAAQGGE